MKKFVATMLSALIIFSLSAVVVSAKDAATVDYADLKYSTGDVSCDGTVNSTDSVLLRKILLGAESSVHKAASDLNNDGEVNIIDLVRLKKSLSKIS